MEEQSRVKKSIVLSGLVGTGGLFVAKLIGIIYAIPFSHILGNVDYMGFYGQAYNIYSYVLNVFTAGFPFAIATMIAKYMVLDDKKTVLMIKRLSISMMALMGFAGMVLMMAFSGFLAPMMVAGDARIMANVLRILSIAIFSPPTLVVQSALNRRRRVKRRGFATQNIRVKVNRLKAARQKHLAFAGTYSAFRADSVNARPCGGGILGLRAILSLVQKRVFKRNRSIRSFVQEKL